MKLIDIKAIRKKAASKRARGSIALKQNRVVSSEERSERHERAQNTPYLDQMLSRA